MNTFQDHEYDPYRSQHNSASNNALTNAESRCHLSTYILSDFALTGLDIYVWKFHPKIFESYYDLIGIMFALWTIFATVWIFRSDAKALGKRLSYSMVLALVFIPPIGSGVHFFGTRNWKTGLLLYVGFGVGIIGSLYINFSLFEWATGSPTLGG